MRRSGVEPVIINIGNYKDHPLSRLSLDSQKFVRKVLKSHGVTDQFIACFLKLLNCFLDITNKAVHVGDDGALAGGDVSTLFLGALYSESFATLSSGLRGRYARALHQVVTAARTMQSGSFQEIPLPTSTAIVSVIKELTSKFDGMSLDEDKVYIWRAWIVRSRTGRYTSLPLLNIHQRLGRRYTERIHAAIAQYVSGRNNSVNRVLPALKALNDFVHAWKGPLGARELTDSIFFARFVELFSRHFIISYIESATWKTVSRIWSSFCWLVGNYFVPTGLVADIKLPKFQGGREGADARTHLTAKADGTVVKTKLFRQLPLHIMNGAVLDQILTDLESEMEVVEKWAETEVAKTNALVVRCRELAGEGSPRMLISPPLAGKKPVFTPIRDSMSLADHAATLHKHGFRTRSRPYFESYFPKPRPANLARELGLPVAGTLVPYAALLVMRNPKITPSFLENIRIYDNRGRKRGLVRTSGGWVLDGRKNRRGFRDAQQIVDITETDRALVEDIIVLTEPLREALKRDGNSDWSLLFLGCGRGFDDAGSPNLSAHTAEPERVRALARDFIASGGLTEGDAEEFATAFSLTRLRAQATVISFIKDPNAYRMAMALGHKRYDPKLLSSYLPDALRKYFDERWIRIFQIGLLLISIKDRQVALKATGLQSHAEGEELLRNYPIAFPASSGAGDVREEDSPIGSIIKSEVLLSADKETFIALNSLKLSVDAASEKVGPNALYYSKLAKRLGAHIEERGNVRNHVRTTWEEAKRESSAKLFAGALYA